MKKIKLRGIAFATVIYLIILITILISINQNILSNDTNRVLDSSNNIELFIEKHQQAQLPDNFQILPRNTKNADTRKIAEGAPYSRALSTRKIKITSAIYRNGQIYGYLRVTESRTSTVFIDSVVIFFALLIYLAAAFITINRARRGYLFTQNTIAKIKNIERSPLTQSYLIGEDDDRITIALNQLGESIQKQILSHTEKKENLYEFTEFFQFPVFVYNAKGSIRKTNAAFKNDFSDTHNLDIFSPYAEFLSFLVNRILHPDIQEKLFYFERISAFYLVRITPLPELDNRFIVTMMDVTRYQRTLDAHNAFIANVSHEFKTPLTSIKGFAELLESGTATPEEAHNFASIINKESTRLMALVQDTLLLTKQNHRIEKKTIDLSKIITEIIKTSERQILEKKLVLTTDLDAISQKTNQQMVHSIFENLIENAIKYTPTNGKIFISLHRDKNQILFSVSDNGHGLTEIQKSRVFDRFYRADESRTSVPGTGLGLAIVKKNVQELHGQVDVVSILGKGSTFTVRL